MKARQHGALEHPVRFTTTPEAPHKNRVERRKNRLTILTVTEVLPGVWVWHASMSYQAGSVGRHALPLGLWTQSQVRKGDRELQSMLDGVGGDFVFGVKPHTVHLPSWDDEDGIFSPDLEVVDPAAHVPLASRSGPCKTFSTQAILEGVTFPATFRAMHLWRELTPEELTHVLN